MGKYLRSKHSYMKLEDEDANCLWPWTLYRIVNHHRWHGFKKLITYKKPKTQSRDPKDKGKRKKRRQASMPNELQNMNSAKAIWSIFGHGLFSKKSKKTSIKPETSSNSSPDLQQSKMKSLDDEDNNNRGYDSNAPTLLSLLKAYPFPKMISTSTNNHEQATKAKDSKDSKQDDSNLLELLRVNQDMFLEMLQDGSSKKPSLVKCGTFPSPNRSRNMVLGTTPSKVEHKHNEVWPMSGSNDNGGGELRRIKLEKLGRMASFNESYATNNGYFDVNVKDIYKKNLSKSLKLRNEKDFMLLALSELPRASLERFNSLNRSQTRGLSFRFGKDSGVGVDESHGDGNNKDGVVVVPSKIDTDQEDKEEEEADLVEVISINGDFEMNDEMMSLGCSSESSFQDGETWDNGNSSNTKDTLCMTITPPTNENVDEKINSFNDNFTHFDKDMDYSNQDLQYVNYILDVMGFSSDNQGPNPLDPAIFDAIEICCPFEPTSKSWAHNNKDTNLDSLIPSCHRKMLFDLVNEALNYIIEQSNGYYPKPLTSICRVRPMLRGENRVVDELLEYISDCLSWRPELDHTLKFAVLHEISDKRTGWMNLQKDSESVGLELEDLIFDELLDEIVYGDLCE